MPINAMIAQGFQPIGRDLPEVANMLYQRKRQEQQDTRRNELVAIEQSQEQRRNAMLDEKMGWERQDRAQASTKEQELADLKRVYPALKAGDPQAFEYVLEQLGPEAGSFYRDKPEQLLEWARREVGDPGEIAFGKTPGGAEYMTQGGKVQGGPHYPQQFAPDRGDNAPSGYRWNKDGSLSSIKGGPGDKQSTTEPFGASDTNAIRGLVTTAFGGVYDPVSGNISGLKSEDARNLNRVAAKASAIYKATPGLSHAEAVEQAFSQTEGSPTPAAPSAGAPPKSRPPLASFARP